MRKLQGKKKLTESAGRFRAFKERSQLRGVTVGDEAEGADAGLAAIYPGEPVRVPRPWMKEVVWRSLRADEIIFPWKRWRLP